MELLDKVSAIATRAVSLVGKRVSFEVVHESFLLGDFRIFGGSRELNSFRFSFHLFWGDLVLVTFCSVTGMDDHSGERIESTLTGDFILVHVHDSELEGCNLFENFGVVSYLVDEFFSVLGLAFNEDHDGIGVGVLSELVPVAGNNLMNAIQENTCRYFLRFVNRFESSGVDSILEV